MRITSYLVGIVSFLFALGLFLPDASGRPKKRRGKRNAKADAEVVEITEEASAGEDGAAAPPDESADEEPKSISDQLAGGDADGSMRRSSRMEFDERLVKGQAAKSGAVYLFKRVPRHLPGLVPMRRSYRHRIVQPVLGDIPLKPARYSFEVERELKMKKRKLAKETPAAAPEAVPAATTPNQTENNETEVSEEKEKPAERSKKRRKK